MTDAGVDTAGESSRSARRQSAPGARDPAIGTHNFSLLIALVMPRRDFRRAAAGCVLPAAQHLQHRPGDRDPRHAGDRADDRDRLGRPRYFGRLDPRHVDGVHRARRRLDRLDRGRAYCSASASAPSPGTVNGLIITVGRDKRGDRHARHHGGVPWVAFIISNGQSISIFDPAFRFIGDGKFFAVPVTILVLVVVVAVFFVLMTYTIIGRNIYAIGGNPVVASLAGLNVHAYQVAIYTLERRRGGTRGHAARPPAPGPGSRFPAPKASNSRRSPPRCWADAR